MLKKKAALKAKRAERISNAMSKDLKPLTDAEKVKKASSLEQMRERMKARIEMLREKRKARIEAMKAKKMNEGGE